LDFFPPGASGAYPKGRGMAILFSYKKSRNKENHTFARRGNFVFLSLWNLRDKILKNNQNIHDVSAQICYSYKSRPRETEKSKKWLIFQ